MLTLESAVRERRSRRTTSKSLFGFDSGVHLSGRGYNSLSTTSAQSNRGFLHDTVFRSGQANLTNVLTVSTLAWYSHDMPINLPHDLEQSVRRHISSGQYLSAEDVLRAALNQFDEMDLVSLKQSADDEKAGRVVSLQAVAASIRRKHNFSDTQ